MGIKYSAGMTSKLFWGLEAKKTAKMVAEGLSYTEIKEMVKKENLYQTSNKERSTRIFGTIIIRLNALGDDLTKMLANSDWNDVKILNMLSIMFTERFIFEFMYEVYRPKIIVADYVICDKDFNYFFSSKQVQSEEVAKWSEASKNKIRQTIFKILREAGFIKIDNKNNKLITPPLVSVTLKNYLTDNKLAEFYYAMTGVR